MARKSKHSTSPFGVCRSFMRVRNKTQREKIEMLLKKSNENYVLACDYQEKYVNSLGEISELKYQLKELEESFKTASTEANKLTIYSCKLRAQLKAERNFKDV